MKIGSRPIDAELSATSPVSFSSDTEAQLYDIHLPAAIALSETPLSPKQSSASVQLLSNLNERELLLSHSLKQTRLEWRARSTQYCKSYIVGHVAKAQPKLYISNL